MKIRALYQKVEPEKYKLKIQYDKQKNKRPAWIKIDGLPKGVSFIRIHLGKLGINGERIVAYKTYLPEGLFLPVDYTPEEMSIFYDKFAEIYDKFLEKGREGTPKQNLLAAEFLLSRVKKFIQKGKMLDLGAGTGMLTEKFVEEGFSPATLIDFSEGMLKKAQKRKKLKGSTFLKQDIKKLDLNEKYDLILSFFSFGSSSYFKKEEIEKSLQLVKKHLKKGGFFAVFGHCTNENFKKVFEEVDSGIYDLSTKKEFYADYFIGRKK